MNLASWLHVADVFVMLGSVRMLVEVVAPVVRLLTDQCHPFFRQSRASIVYGLRTDSSYSCEVILIQRLQR
jgi:hypothetical protein